MVGVIILYTFVSINILREVGGISISFLFTLVTVFDTCCLGSLSPKKDVFNLFPAFFLVPAAIFWLAHMFDAGFSFTGMSEKWKACQVLLYRSEFIFIKPTSSLWPAWQQLQPATYQELFLKSGTKIAKGGEQAVSETVRMKAMIQQTAGKPVNNSQRHWQRSCSISAHVTCRDVAPH